MRIASVASAFPSDYYQQEVLVEALKNDWRHRLPNPDILDRLDESMKVDGRYLVRPIDFYEEHEYVGSSQRRLDRSRARPRRRSAVPRAAAAGIEAERISARFL